MIQSYAIVQCWRDMFTSKITSCDLPNATQKFIYKSEESTTANSFKEIFIKGLLYVSNSCTANLYVEQFTGLVAIVNKDI